jgi:hypothetical protein
MSGLVSAAATWPLAARAQQPERMRRIGIFMPGTADNSEFQDRNVAFLQGLAEKGWAPRPERTVRLSLGGGPDRARQ